MNGNTGNADILSLGEALFYKPSRALLDELMLAGRHRFQCLAMGHRLATYRPVVLKRRRRSEQLMSRYGWPRAFMADWVRKGYAQDFSIDQIHTSEAPVCAWRLKAARRRTSGPMKRSIDFMLAHGITAGITVRVPRLNGDCGSLICIYDAPRGALASEIARTRAAELFYLTGSVIHALERLEPASPLPQLTAQQITCLRWVKEGKTDAQIAAILDRSVNTVRYHLKAALRGLGASNRAQAVAMAIQYRII